MRISDWSSDVCSSDLEDDGTALEDVLVAGTAEIALAKGGADHRRLHDRGVEEVAAEHHEACLFHRSEEHTSELQSLMRISYAVFCVKKKKTNAAVPRSRTSLTYRAVQQRPHTDNAKAHGPSRSTTSVRT